MHHIFMDQCKKLWVIAKKMDSVRKLRMSWSDLFSFNTVLFFFSCQSFDWSSRQAKNQVPPLCPSPKASAVGESFGDTRKNDLWKRLRIAARIQPELCIRKSIPASNHFKINRCAVLSSVTIAGAMLLSLKTWFFYVLNLHNEVLIHSSGYNLQSH